VPDDADTLALLQRARAGDGAAFGLLVRQHQSAVRAQLRRLLRGDAARADDLAQEVFVQAWMKLPQFRGDARLATWLYRIAWHQYLMTRRSQAPDTVAEEALGSAQPAAAESDTDPALRLDLARALDALPEAQRVAVVHCGLLGLSHEEAATLLELPLGTVKSNVTRGKARLRAALADWAPGDAR
jgi:RNA polymerase sigma factor (sigma-70 family)